MNETVQILYEDNHLLAVEKPPGLLTQSDSTGKPDLLNQCKQYIGQKYQKPNSVYLGMVQRLDRTTGGVVLFARTSKAASRLSEQFRNHSVKKSYVALLDKNPEGILPYQLTDFLQKDTKNKKAVLTEASSPNAKQAKLSWKSIDRVRTDNIFAIQVWPVTGRFHQIRFQFATRGFPLIGDKKYGGQIHPVAKGFVCLWATELQIEHPTKKQLITLTSKPPANWHLAM